MKSAALRAVAIVPLLLGAPGVSRGEPPAEWRTVAETTDFAATSSYDETMSFLEKLAAAKPEIEVLDFGVSAQRRRMRLVAVSSDKAFTPQAAARTGKAVVMIQNGIHAGEIDGKDASLMILRDIALGEHRELLEGVILLVVPMYNVDGHERVSPYNRPNQDGPVHGMGFRTTADGHDLNRDHLKLSTPEARQMIALFNRWRPHLHVDNHVTNGADHDWVLTYSWVEGPQAPPAIAAWLDTHMPRVVEATRRSGHRVGPYVSLLDRDDPSKGFNSYVGQPRYATGYYPLRNRPSILVENHSYKTYERRVLANRDFMLALLEEIASSPQDLIDAVGTAERLTVKRGRPDAPASNVVLRYTETEATDRVLFSVYEWYHEPSEVLGVPLLRFRRGKLREIEVPWVHRSREAVTAPRPRGYLVLPGWPDIESRLAGHALRVEELRRAVELDVQVLRLSGPETSSWANPSYQGLTGIRVNVERRTERRRFPPGTLWVPADQPDFEVAVQLLEPEAPDSMTRWGLLNIVLERKEYIGAQVLEEVVREMLQDPEHAAAWKEALRDEAFAGNPSARAAWWYRRTVYWDETVGLLPVMRLMKPARLETVPWSAPANSLE